MRTVETALVLWRLRFVLEIFNLYGLEQTTVDTDAYVQLLIHF